MLDLAGDDMPAQLATGLCHTFQGQVVGLGSARGPDDLLRPGIDQLRDLLSGQFYRMPGLLTKDVGAGSWIAKVAFKAQAFDHHLDDTSVHGSGGRVIEIKRSLVHCSNPLSAFLNQGVPD